MTLLEFAALGVRLLERSQVATNTSKHIGQAAVPSLQHFCRYSKL